MGCYYPLHGWYGQKGESGKRAVVFSPSEAYHTGAQISVPCGRCIGCRLERARQWAVRCLFEASLYEDNCFITLTYDNEHLPIDLSLNKDHFQLFMKRLRRANPRLKGNGIRYYQCGEYGDANKRPHYHACLFNFDFKDKIEINASKSGSRQWISPHLVERWGMGFSTIGQVNFESAGYVAKYVMKKAISSGVKVYPDGRIHEFTNMSRRPGIGSEWYEKFKSDVFPHDYVIVNGKKVRPPIYYYNLLKKQEEEMFDEVHTKRAESNNYVIPAYLRLAGLPDVKVDGSAERLATKAEVKEAKASLFSRDL